MNVDEIEITETLLSMYHLDASTKSVSLTAEVADANPQKIYAIMFVNKKEVLRSPICVEAYDMDRLDLCQMYLLPDDRRKGYASFAVQMILRAAQHVGFKYLQARLPPKGAAIKWLEATGWKKNAVNEYCIHVPEKEGDIAISPSAYFVYI